MYFATSAPWGISVPATQAAAMMITTVTANFTEARRSPICAARLFLLSACLLMGHHGDAPLFLVLYLRIRVRDLFDHRFLVESLEVRAFRVVAQFAALGCRIDHVCGHSLGMIFHGALGHVLLAGPVTGLTPNAVLGFEFLGGHGFCEIIRGRVALQAFAAGLGVIDPEFLADLFRCGRAECLKGFGV